jgi:hypothetical protein
VLQFLPSEKCVSERLQNAHDTPSHELGGILEVRALPVLPQPAFTPSIPVSGDSVQFFYV